MWIRTYDNQILNLNLIRNIEAEDTPDASDVKYHICYYMDEHKYYDEYFKTKEERDGKFKELLAVLTGDITYFYT